MLKDVSRDIPIFFPMRVIVMVFLKLWAGVLPYC